MSNQIMKRHRAHGNSVLSAQYSCEGFPGGSVVKNPPADAGPPVQSLVWEDPTCHRATKPVCTTTEPVL